MCKKSFLIVAIFAALLIGACDEEGSGTVEPQPEPAPGISAGLEGGACLADGTCNEGLVCTDSKCVLAETPPPPLPPSECQADTDCKDGKVCKDNVCVVVTPPAPECIADADCKDGKVCKEGKCEVAEIKDPCKDIVCKDEEKCENGLCVAIIPPPAAEKIFYVGTISNGVFKFSGGEWVEKNNGLSIAGSKNIYGMIQVDNAIYVATDNGVYLNVITSGNDLWVPLSGSLIGDDKKIYDIVYDGSNGIYIGTKSGKVFKYNSKNKNWVLFGQKLESSIRNLLVDSNNIYAATANGKIYKYSIGGSDNWDQVGGELKNVKCLSINQTKTHLLAGGEGVYKFQIDGGESWKQISNGLNTSYSKKVYDFAVPTYIATWDGIFYTKNLIFIEWEALNEGLTDKNVIVLEKIDDNFFAGTNSGQIFKLNGNVWESMGNLETAITTIIGIN